MPELPEVEVICRSLEPKLIGKTIVDCKVFLKKLIQTPNVKVFEKEVRNHKITAVKRRGKYIQIFMEDDWVMVVHLRMTGKLLLKEIKSVPSKYGHIWFLLDDDSVLWYEDIRQFGVLYLTKRADLYKLPGLKDLGPEPLENEFTVEVLQKLMEGKTQKIKGFLLDQRNIAGIGNIYADEILFQAKIHPESITKMICDAKVQEELYESIKEKLQQGIAYGGSSVKDYVDAQGKKGSFQEMHQVYGKAGQLCVCCGNKLKKMQSAGRSSVVCERCQIKY